MENKRGKWKNVIKLISPLYIIEFVLRESFALCHTPYSYDELIVYALQVDGSWLVEISVDTRVISNLFNCEGTSFYTKTVMQCFKCTLR